MSTPIRYHPGAAGVSDASTGSEADVTVVELSTRATYPRDVASQSIRVRTICSVLPAIGTPWTSVTIAFTVSGFAAGATYEARMPMKSGDGSAVNEVDEATARFDASVVVSSTSYTIGNGRSAETATACTDRPCASVKPFASMTFGSGVGA